MTPSTEAATIARLRLRRRAMLAGLATASWWPGATRAAPGDPQATTRPGVALLIRHAATEPGTGDPPGMRLGECRTQRNLSAAGREQARRLGPALVAAGWRPGPVRSSRWCRCLDTATLAFGRVDPWPALDSFFDDRSRAPAQTDALLAALAALPRGEVQAWVTHMVNIQALAGDAVGMGEVLVVRAERGAEGRLRAQVIDRLNPSPR